MRTSQFSKILFLLTVPLSLTLLFSLQLFAVSAQVAVPPAPTTPVDDELLRLMEMDFEGDAFTPGMSLALQNGLIEPLNLSQTIKTITVKVYWAYADERSMTVRYALTGPHGIVLEELLKDVRLVLPDNGDKVQGSRHLAGDPFAPKDTITVQGDFTLPEDFTHEGDEIPLVLEVNGDGTRIEALDAQFNLPQPESTAEPKPEGDVFRIEFSVPFYKSTQLNFDPDDAIDAHDGVTLKITEVTTTPTTLYVTTCIETPRFGAWQVAAAEATVNDFYLASPSQGGFNDGCFRTSTDFYWQGEPLNMYMMIQDIVEQPLVDVFVDMPENDFRFVMDELRDRGGFVELTDDRKIIGFGSEVAEVLADYGYAEHFDGTWEINVTATAPEEEE